MGQKIKNPKKIRVEINISGTGKQAHEFEHCPISLLGNKDCPIVNELCAYGLTNIEPPISCPMTNGEMHVVFKII